MLGPFRVGASLLLVAFPILRGLSYVPFVLALYDFDFSTNFEACSIGPFSVVFIVGGFAVSVDFGVCAIGRVPIALAMPGSAGAFGSGLKV